MKIDASRGALEADKLSRADQEAPRKTERTASEPASSASGQTDRVEMSDDAKIVARAAKVASAVPEIRRDVVERARALLDSGTLVVDSTSLADAIIDDLLKRP